MTLVGNPSYYYTLDSRLPPRYLRRSFGLRPSYSSRFRPQVSTPLRPLPKSFRPVFYFPRTPIIHPSILSSGVQHIYPLLSKHPCLITNPTYNPHNLRSVQQFPIHAFTLPISRARILDWESKLGGSMIQFSSGSDVFLLLFSMGVSLSIRYRV